MSDSDKNTMNAWALLIVPLLVAALIREVIPGIDLLLVETWQKGVYYAVALVIGIFVFGIAIHLLFTLEEYFVISLSICPSLKCTCQSSG